MAQPIPFRKLFKAGVSTSIIISILAIANIAIVHSLPAAGIIKGILHHSFLIFFIWLINILLLIPAERGRNKAIVYLRYFTSYIICASLMVLIRHVILSISGHHDTELSLRSNPAAVLNSGSHFIGFVMVMALNTIVLIMQDLIVLKDRKAKIELENAALSLKNAEVVNQQLKQQIQPHFLFNSLNTLKILISKNNEKAEEYLLLLSGFLRYAVSTDMPNIISLKEEINLCNTYLKMQQMRFGNALHYIINVPETIQNKAGIPPFALLPLLENAIKHNSLTNVSPLNIHITYKDGRIVMSNNKQKKDIVESSSGVGLKNLSERYKIISGDEIQIVDNDHFSVSLKLFLDEGSDH